MTAQRALRLPLEPKRIVRGPAGTVGTPAILKGKTPETCLPSSSSLPPQRESLSLAPGDRSISETGRGLGRPEIRRRQRPIFGCWTASREKTPVPQRGSTPGGSHSHAALSNRPPDPRPHFSALGRWRRPSGAWGGMAAGRLWRHAPRLEKRVRPSRGRPLTTTASWSERGDR